MTSEIPVKSASAQMVEKRCASHSHIRGLGLADDGTATAGPCGFIGQAAAREAMGVVVEMVRAKRMSGRAVLLAGPPGSGKTALALALAHELGPRVPFCPIVGSDVYSAEIKGSEVLAEALRRAIGLRVREVKEVYEGEVVEYQVHETDAPLSARGKAISHVALTLRTAKGSRTIKLDPSIHEVMLKARVSVGDVVYVEAGSGAVKRLGRLDTRAAEHDLEADEFVPLPLGDVHRKREVIQEVTLHDLDMANARPTGGTDALSLVGQMMKPRRTEITDRLRDEVNRMVDAMLTSGQAELVPGVLFLDEAHLLDLECMAWLNRAIESPISPILVLATNRGMAQVRGTEDLISPHGIPRDLLDRLLIVRTVPLDLAEIANVLSIRARTEAIQLTDAALSALATFGQSRSLRYSMQLLHPASLCAQTHGRDSVEPQDVEEAASLFLDTQRSAQLLQ